MEKIQQIEMDEEIKKRLPSLVIEYIEVKGIKVVKKIKDLEDMKLPLVEEWKGATKESIKENSKILAYRKYFKRQQVDFNTVPPAVENIITRALSKGVFPTINSVVDGCNVISVKNLLPIGVFDLDKIKGKIRATYPGMNNKYTPIAGERKEIKNQRRVVLRDDEKIISIPCYRDSEYTKITEETKNVVILTLIVDGINKDEAEKTLIEAKNLLLSY